MNKYMRYAAGAFLGLFMLAASAQADPILKINSHKSEYRDAGGKAVYLKTSFDTVEIENAARYPALNEAVRRRFNEVRRKQMQTAVKENASGCQEITRELAKENGFNLTCFSEEKAEICRADDTVVSLSCAVSEFYGGAHPNSAVLSYNFDTLSGRELKLADVVTDRRELSRLAVSALKAEFKAREAEFGEDIANQLRELLNKDAAGKEPMTWTVSKDGLTLRFDPYTFGPYALGRFDLKIKFAGHEAVFAKKYLPGR